MNEHKKQKGKSQTHTSKPSTQKQVAFVNQPGTGVSSPHAMKSPSHFSSALPQFDSDQPLTHHQIKQVGVPKVFNYMVSSQEKISFNQVPQSNVSQEPEPQFSMHSPFRKGESKKDPSSKNHLMNSGTDSVVRGRIMQNKEVDIVCTVNDSDSQRMQTLKGSTDTINFYHKDKAKPFLVNPNAQSQQNLPVGQMQGLLMGREGSADSQARNIQRRKNSTDSRNGSKRSTGKEGKKNSKNSPANSLTRNKTIQALNPQLGTTSSSQQKTLKRPMSAKNLKQGAAIHNSTQNLKTLITSPTQGALPTHCDSQQVLPPKPRPSKNQVISKGQEILYSSLTSMPVSLQSQHGGLSQYTIQSQNKRGPSYSSERPVTAHPQLNKNKNIQVFDEQVVSPQRRKEGTAKTQRTHNKGKGTKKQSSSRQKNKGVKDPQMTISPKIERIKPQQMIQEDSQEEVSTYRGLLGGEVKANKMSFEESAIKGTLKSQENQQQESQEDSSLQGLKQDKIKIKSSKLKENFNDLYQQVKSQFQKISQNEEERKKKKVEKKEKLSKDPDSKKLNIETLKQQMQRKLESTNKGLNLKKKNSVAQFKNQQDLEDQMIKQKKQEQREQWIKEKQERLEAIEMMKDAQKEVVQLQNKEVKKRDQSKSQKRVNSTTRPSQEYVFVKVPPVNHDLTSNSQDDYTAGRMSPLRDQERNVVHGIEDYTSNQINDFIKKQKRERSKRKKEQNEKEKMQHQKKEQQLLLLKKEQQKRQFENFKQNLIQQTKIKLQKGKKYKSQQNTEYYQSQQNVKKLNYRSKSKRKIDEEKENRRFSSDSKEKIVLSDHKSKTGKRKNKKKGTISEAKLKVLTKNVQELMTQHFNEGQLNNFLQGSVPKYNKSNTIADLHSHFQNEQELKHIMQSVKMRMGASSKDRDQGPDEAQARSQEAYSYLHQTKNTQEKLDFYRTNSNISSEQLRDLTPNLTPILVSKKKDNKNTSSMASSQAGYVKISQQTKSHQVSQTASLDGNFLKKLDQKTLMEMLRSANFNPGILKKLKVKSPNQKRKSRSASKDEHGRIKSQRGKRSPKRILRKPEQVGEEEEQSSPYQITIQNQKVEEKEKKEVKRKVSADYKRTQSGKFKQSEVVVQKEEVKERQEVLSKFRSEDFEREEKKAGAVLKIQSCFRGFRERKTVRQYKKERIEREMDRLKEKYLEDRPLSNKKGNDDSFKMSENDDQSPLKADKQTEDQLQYSDSKNEMRVRRKKSRPSSNDVNIIDVKKTPIIFEYDKQSQRTNYQPDEQILNAQKKVQDRIDYQENLNKRQEEEAKKIKGQVPLDTISMQTSIKDDLMSLNQLKQQTSKSPFYSQKLYNQFDSLSSVQLLSKMNSKDFDLEKPAFTKSGQANIMIESRKDSFLEDVTEGKSSPGQNLQKTTQDGKVKNIKMLGIHHKIGDGWSSAKKKHPEEEQKGQFFKKLMNSGYHHNDAHSQLISSNSFLQQSSIEDNQNHWQFNRNSFQDFFEQNSQAEDSARKATRKGKEQSSSKPKLVFQRKINQFEEMLNALSSKNEKDKEELKKLQNKRHLSPMSQKKKLQLEKWVNKQEKQIDKKKKWYQENVNDMIQKIDKELQITKKKVGSNKKIHNKFNTSVDWSHDVSDGHLSHSSIQSATPRDKGTRIIKNIFNNNLETAQTERNGNKRVPFEYKVQPGKDNQHQVQRSNELTSQAESQDLVHEARNMEFAQKSPQKEEILTQTLSDNLSKKKKKRGHLKNHPSLLRRKLVATIFPKRIKILWRDRNLRSSSHRVFPKFHQLTKILYWRGQIPSLNPFQLITKMRWKCTLANSKTMVMNPSRKLRRMNQNPKNPKLYQLLRIRSQTKKMKRIMHFWLSKNQVKSIQRLLIGNRNRM